MFDFVYFLILCKFSLCICISKAGQDNKLKIKGGNESGGNRKESPRKSLKWYGNVMRREERYTGRRAMEMKVQGRRKRGRPKRKWLDSVRGDIKEKGLSGRNCATVLHGGTSYIDPT